ncbi:MAG: rod shape-determining protein MreC [Eubacteriales bacterium]|nr:rod shape-determining protein MreC [Eubacteriales bacterium]
MKQRRKIEFSPKFLLILFTVICILLVMVSAMFSKVTKPFSVIVSTIIVPMQDGINSIGLWADDYFESFEDMKTLREENEKLANRVEELTHMNENLSTDQEELESLRALLVLDEEYKEYKKVGARVISNGRNNWYENFVINKGSQDGIKKNMNVLSGRGLVGIVTEVGANYAKVQSIIADGSNVSAMSVSTLDTCVVKGNAERIHSDGNIDVAFISKDADMKSGDELVTSHISSKYLPGLRIGNVNDITIDSSNLTKSAHVTPVVDFQHIKEVLVILDLKEVPDDVETAD